MTKEMLLVTGSTGLMGEHFVNLVSQDPRYLLRRFVGDIKNMEDVVRNLRSIDTVVHFAALTFIPTSWEQPHAYMSVNYGGTMNLLECHNLFKKFVYISTSQVFGNQNLPVSSTSLPVPNDPYCISKMATENAVKLYTEQYKLDTLIPCPFNNFGPGQSVQYVVPTMIRQALTTGAITLRGNSGREFIYVKDNVRAIKALMDKGVKGNVYICKGESYLITSVAEQILKILGLDPKNVTVLSTSDRPRDVSNLVGDPTLFRQLLPDFEFTPMNDALRETIEYYRG